MRVIVGFMFLLGVVFSLILLKFNFSNTVDAVLLSLIVGIIIFILTSGLIYSGLSEGKNRSRNTEDRIRKNKKIANSLGIIFMIVFIIIFFNFYLYLKAMMGSDLLVSLGVKDENIQIKNGEEVQINVIARVLTNPFCIANCSLVVEDLGNEKLLYSDNFNIKVSSPLSRDYIINNYQENFGQNLYKVNLECNTIKEKFCYVKESSSKLRSKIISVDYELNDVQNLIKNNLKNDTETLNREVYVMKQILDSMNLNVSQLDFTDLKEKRYSIRNSLSSLSPAISLLNNLYLSQEYSKLGTEIYPVKEKISNLSNSINKLNSSFVGNITNYNLLIDNITLMYDEIKYLEEYPFSNESIILGESFARHFNEFILNMKKKDTLENKTKMFNQLVIEKNNLFSVLENESSDSIIGDNFMKVSIYPVILNKIPIEEQNYVSYFTLDEPPPTCCLKGDCYRCINDSSLNYPVILVHGHSFNEKLSAELSMESFSGMARELEKEGYLDAGYFYGSKYDEDSSGYLGKVNTSIIVKATYYLDTLETEENSFIFDSKWESIDTYASRLNEVISNVKYLSGKDKVIIVAHSMGGLVTRRYIQLYGEDSLDRVILVGIPNHGVDGFVLNYCSVFGADLECSEMNKSSAFLEELNNYPLPNIPVYNIVGLGCFWEGSDGDGIVKNESAYLEGVENIYVNGTCNVVDFFHVRMIKPKNHPEIYEIIKDLIER